MGEEPQEEESVEKYRHQRSSLPEGGLVGPDVESGTRN